MRRLRFLALGVVALFSVELNSARAGKIYLQARSTRSVCRVPNYDYRATAPKAVTVVSSGEAIPFGQTEQRIADPINNMVRLTQTGGGSNTDEPVVTSVIVVPAGQRYVFDNVTAGPLVFTNVSGLIGADGFAHVTGMLLHNGGDSGQLLGGKTVLRADLLAAEPEAIAGFPIVATGECCQWVLAHQPTPVDVRIPLPKSVSVEEIRIIRLYLEYHSSR